MSGTSTKSQVISIRLPNEIVETIKRRFANNRFDSISAYLRDRIIYDFTRKHKRFNRPQEVSNEQNV